jgi:hypothetical protein
MRVLDGLGEALGSQFFGFTTTQRFAIGSSFASRLFGSFANLSGPEQEEAKKSASKQM